ncbi:MAG: amidohydrolase family protein [Flavobacteriales bacterium]|nr:amidohydrolase family protein [Flavobacteriales bacterium]
MITLRTFLPLVAAAWLTTPLYAQVKKLRVGPAKAPVRQEALFHDAHFHLTNYIQEGLTAKYYLDSIMGDKIGRSTLFGIPLQQQWSHRVTGKNAPTYYLESDAPLYYYSFTDAFIAMQYRSLGPEQQKRLDPMITGFNPTDMYAADHIRRVLLTFPGVFSGVGEFSIHKEFVSSKVSGDVASLTDPALDRIMEFCGEAGLVVILHNDIDNPFPKPGAPNYLDAMKELARRHPNTTIIWAHVGVGRVVHPIDHHADAIEAMLADPTLKNLYFDISWDETAKYIVGSDSALARTVRVLERYPDRILFGTDNVAPATQEKHLKVYRMYVPLWKALTPSTSHAVRLGNYERLFDDARGKVRAWEAAHVGRPMPIPPPSPASGAGGR